jgi:5-methylcytosine-specific restriction endonuclease McrA
MYLQAHPLCTMCLGQNPPKITPATVVDHKTPHHGDQALFWSESNWQSLCARHHNSDKQAFEKTGRILQRIGLDGYPIEAPTKAAGKPPGATK